MPILSHYEKIPYFASGEKIESKSENSGAKKIYFHLIFPLIVDAGHKLYRENGYVCLMYKIVYDSKTGCERKNSPFETMVKKFVGPPRSPSNFCLLDL